MIIEEEKSPGTPNVHDEVVGSVGNVLSRLQSFIELRKGVEVLYLKASSCREWTGIVQHVLLETDRKVTRHCMWVGIVEDVRSSG